MLQQLNFQIEYTLHEATANKTTIKSVHILKMPIRLTEKSYFILLCTNSRSEQKKVMYLRPWRFIRDPLTRETSIHIDMLDKVTEPLNIATCLWKHTYIIIITTIIRSWKWSVILDTIPAIRCSITLWIPFLKVYFLCTLRIWTNIRFAYCCGTLWGRGEGDMMFSLR